MQVIDAPVSSATVWIKQAFRFYRAQPLNWLVLTWTWMMIILFGLALPAFLTAFVMIIKPALFAGLMIACRDQEQGKPVSLAHLGAGFRANGRALIVVGAVMMLAMIPVLMIMQYLYTMVDFPKTVPVTSTGELDLPALSAQMDGKVWVLGVDFALTSLINALFWFSAPLLAFRKMPPQHAVRWSIYALAANFMPLLLLSILLTMMMVAGLFAALIGFVLIFPMTFIVNYTSYREVFPGD